MPPPLEERTETPLTIFGGTFDPIHLGHLHAIAQIRKQFNLGELLVVPAGEPWQKSDREIASARDRFKMCKLAFVDEPTVTVSDLEIIREGRTYTMDTVEELKRRTESSRAESNGSNRVINLVIGADSLKTLHTWERYEELIKAVHIVVCARPEYPILADQLPFGGFTLIEVDALPISSTMVRERLKSEVSAADLLPDAVLRYIVEHRLYGASQAQGVRELPPYDSL